MKRLVCLVLATALLGPTGCANRAKRSVALYESGDYAGALRAADEGLASHPGDNGLWSMKVRSALALGDADAITKAYASYVASRGENDKELLRDLATATIAQALASPSAKLEIAAIEAVESLEIHALADQVALRMESSDDRVVAAAAVAVLRGFPEAPKVAEAMLESDNAEARRIVLEGIAKKYKKLAVGDLEDAAKSDRDPRVRRAAVRWLGQIKDKDAVEILMKRAKDPDDSVRAAAVIALGQIGIGNLPAIAKQALADRSLAVRLAGVDVLRDARQDAELVALIDDKDPMVALTAAMYAKSAPPELKRKAVERALGAEEWTMRAGTANLLVPTVGKETARTYAQKLVADPDVRVRLAGARVLAYSGDVIAAKPIFSAALSDSDAGIQAAGELATLGDPTGIDALSAAVRDMSKTPEQRIAAVAAHRNAHRVTPGLVGALADASALVRIEAATTIGALAK
ncbi:MAG: HEAT repeat domain-containing protein [Kofleriaceae bacterium]|nr:HEAT repeat domain-containing protein [Kofleriaceae bacterium]